MGQKRLIIIGGGITGLVIARELCAFYDVTLLEGQSHWGGRIQSFTSTDGTTILEAGAEFIHGKLKHTLELLDEAGIDYHPIEGKMYRKAGQDWEERETMTEGWDKLLTAMSRLDQDVSLNEFFDQHFGGDEKSELRHQAMKFAEGFDLADPGRASVKALYKEWTAEQDVNYRITTGYGSLVEYMVATLKDAGVHMLEGDKVKQLDWEQGEVRAYTATGNTYDAEAVVLTIPIKVFAKAGGAFSINITPPLDPQVKAAGEIGMGTVIKFIFRFDEVLWPQDTGFILSDEEVPTWWTRLPDTQPFLTGWMGGPSADRLSGLSDDELIERALLSLSRILGKEMSELKNHIREARVFNWQTNEAIQGGYTYATPKTSVARTFLQHPVGDTIYFSGEGIYEGNSPGTVEAAIIQAKKTALEVLQRDARRGEKGSKQSGGR